MDRAIWISIIVRKYNNLLSMFPGRWRSWSPELSFHHQTQQGYAQRGYLPRSTAALAALVPVTRLLLSLFVRYAVAYATEAS